MEKKHTGRTKQLISDNHANITGENNPMYGLKHTEETKKLMSDAKSGDKHPMYGKTGELCPHFGKHLTEEHKKKISGEKAHNATITDYIAKMIKIRIAEGSKDRPIAEEFNTTQCVVSGIRHGRNWKHVTI